MKKQKPSQTEQNKIKIRYFAPSECHEKQLCPNEYYLYYMDKPNLNKYETQAHKHTQILCFFYFIEFYYIKHICQC